MDDGCVLGQIYSNWYDMLDRANVIDCFVDALRMVDSQQDKTVSTSRRARSKSNNLAVLRRAKSRPLNVIAVLPLLHQTQQLKQKSMSILLLHESCFDFDTYPRGLHVDVFRCIVVV